MSKDGKLKAVRQNEKYYLRGGDLHLLAEDQLFRVHRYFFERESERFRDQLSRPVSPGKQPQGTTDSNAIMLSVSANDLEKLLWVFYNPKYSLYDASVEDWSVILRLAHIWAFPEVKSLALRELESTDIPVVDRLVLYQTYHVEDKILIPRYVELCARDEFLTVEEGNRLGLTTTLMICNIREQLRSSSANGSKSPLPPGLEFEDVYATIQAILSGTPATARDRRKGRQSTNFAGDSKHGKKGEPNGTDGNKRNEDGSNTAGHKSEK